MRNDVAIGALNLESDKLAAYGNHDVEVLRFFTDAAAISIEKAMMHRQILEKERIEEQLRVARDVQARLLPDEPPDVVGYDFSGSCISTFEIGGDCFDYIGLPDDKIGLVVSDVSGEGVPAALIMAAFRALLRGFAQTDSDPARVAQMLNRLLPDFTGKVDFVTAVYGILDPQSGNFDYVNCGHNPPMIFRNGGSIERLNRGGPMLSILDDVEYDSGRVELDPGSLMLLYTDGVVEVINEAEEEFGVDRLKAVVHRFQGLPAAELVHQIILETQAFCDSRSFEDDFTLLVVKREARG